METASAEKPPAEKPPAETPPTEIPSAGTPSAETPVAEKVNENIEREKKEPVVIAEEKEIITTIRKPTIRRLHQTEAVVLPANQAVSLSSVNVQFGSLNLSNGEETSVTMQEDIIEEVVVVKDEAVVARDEVVVVKEDAVVKEDVAIAKELVKEDHVMKVEQAPAEQVPAAQVPTGHAPVMQAQVPMVEQAAPAGLVGYKPPQEGYTMNPYHNGYTNNMMPAEYNMYPNTMEQQRMVSDI